MGKIRVGVVGVGFGQAVHVPAFRMDTRCEVTAICASSLERANEVADRLAIGKAFGNWREMVRSPDIDAVSIAAPPSIQADIALAALSARKAVFCEKPLAASKHTALEMVMNAERSGLPNMVDFEFAEIEEWRKAKTILDSGGIGALRHLAVSWNVETYTNRMGLESWKTRPEEGGGTLNAFVSHVFYYVERFAGPITRLCAGLFRAPGDQRTGDTFDAVSLELESGIGASISVSTHAFLGNGHRIELYGDEGTLVLENSTPDYVKGFRLLHGTRATGRFDEVSSSGLSGTAKSDGRIEAVARLVGRFLDWIETGVPATPRFHDGLRVQGLLEAARRSHESGCWEKGPF